MGECASRPLQDLIIFQEGRNQHCLEQKRLDYRDTRSERSRNRSLPDIELSEAVPPRR